MINELKGVEGKYVSYAMNRCWEAAFGCTHPEYNTPTKSTHQTGLFGMTVPLGWTTKEHVVSWHGLDDGCRLAQPKQPQHIQLGNVAWLL